MAGARRKAGASSWAPSMPRQSVGDRSDTGAPKEV